jgi:hypothetical protein
MIQTGSIRTSPKSGHTYNMPAQRNARKIHGIRAVRRFRSRILARADSSYPVAKDVNVGQAQIRDVGETWAKSETKMRHKSNRGVFRPMAAVSYVERRKDSRIVMVEELTFHGLDSSNPFGASTFVD